MSQKMRKNLTLVVFIDAYGWEIYKKAPMFKSECRYTYPLESVFGYSSACDPTIITGAMPAEHGHFSSYFYAPDCSPFKRLSLLHKLPARIRDSGRVRQKLSSLIARIKGYTGYFQFYNMPFNSISKYDYTEKKNIYAPGGIVGGTSTIFDELRQQGKTCFVSDWRKDDSSTFESFQENLKDSRPDFAYLILGQLDALLHREGTKSKNLHTLIEWYERNIKKILKICKLKYDDVTLSIISDHGMTDVSYGFDIEKELRKRELRINYDYEAVFDSTMARFWFPTSEMRQLVKGVLADFEEGEVLSKRELTELGVYFPDERYGQEFFLLKPGIMINPSHMGTNVIAGMHGYHPSHDTSGAVLLRTAPSFFSPTHLKDLKGIFMRDCLGDRGEKYEAKAS